METSPTDRSDSPPGVTVVIPCYNYARFLAGAIDSVLRQDYSPVEIIVVDDGSTDNTREVVARFGERVCYLHQENAGVSAARNTGIRAARYAFVAFLDADDEWLPGMLSTALGAFSRLSPDFGLVACSCQKVDAARTPLPKTALRTCQAREVFVQDLILMSQFNPSAVVARREVLEKTGGFDVTLSSSEDRDMWIRMTEHARIYFLPDLLVSILVHSGSLSRHADRMKQNMDQVLRRARQRGGHSSPLTLCFWAKARAFYHYQVAWMYMDAGRPWVAMREMLQSLACCPMIAHPEELHENVGFRIRSLVSFACRIVRRRA